MKTNNKQHIFLPVLGIAFLGFLFSLMSCKLNHEGKNSQDLEQNQELNVVHKNSLPGNNPPFKASLDMGEKTQVLILGTPHLRQFGENFMHSSLSGLLDILEGFDPDMIGVESIPSDRLEEMENREMDFAQVIDHFAKNRIDQGHTEQEVLKLNRQEAAIRVEELMDIVREEPDNKIARAKLVKHLIASYDDISAVLQWSLLPQEFRDNNNLITPFLRSFLDEKMTTADERYSLGVALGKRLGISRMSHIDDHHDKDIYMKIAAELSSQLKDNPLMKEVSSNPFYTESNNSLQKAHQNNNLLPYYIRINSTEYGQKDMDLQWNIWFRTHLDSGLDRCRIALWEVRNLNIASHIRRATASHPGKRFLVIIGAGHKPFLDAYLSQMADIRIVQLEDLL